MEVMARPSKEQLIFSRKIRVYAEKIIPGSTPEVIFKKDTPKDIIDLFNDIKNKIGYKLGM